MTPERLHMIRQDVDYATRPLRMAGVDPPAAAIAAEDLLREVDRLRAENYLLRQGRGGTPETHTANDRTPLHLTHPIENSRETT